jgi:hypothetical protein
MGFPELFASVLGALLLAIWVAVELYWAGRSRFGSSGSDPNLDDRLAEDD